MEITALSLMRNANRRLKNRRLTLLAGLMLSVCSLTFVLFLSAAAQSALLRIYADSGNEGGIAAFSDKISLLVTAVAAVALLAVFEPLFMGFKRMVWLSMRGNTPCVSDVFWCYSPGRLFRAVLLKWSVWLRLTVWLIVFLLPSMIFSAFFDSKAAVFVKYLLLGTGICLFLIKLISYGAADYVFFEDEYKKTREIIASSVGLFGVRSGNFGFAALIFVTNAACAVLCSAVPPALAALPIATACSAYLTLYAAGNETGNKAK